MPKVVFLIGAFPSPCGEKVGINYPYYGGLKISGYDREFPSPCGEKVGINGPFLRIVNGEFQGFPSPCGEKVGINKQSPFSKNMINPPVSVPLRGKGRDQHC